MPKTNVNSCHWKEEPCDEAYIEKQYTNMGLCYTVNWNSEDILKAKDTGKHLTSFLWLLDINTGMELEQVFE